MPSIKKKTHKGTQKRFKVSATGKVRHKPCGSSHINSHKTGSKIRKLRGRRTLENTAVSRHLRSVMGVRVGGKRPKVTAGAPDVDAGGEAQGEG